MAVALHANRQPPASDEQELVGRVRRGDDRAFEELYSRYRPRIGAYVQRMVSDHGRAEDIAQEVFIAALRRLRATDQPVIFKPWLYEIAKNACIDEFRRARRAQEVSLYGGEEREDVYSLRSLSPSPDAAIESKQRLADLRGAFRGLSESHHRILVLRELEGLSYNQISDRMGLSKPVVESTLFRARRRLGEEFEELESGRRCARVQGMIAAADVRPVQSLGLRERRLLSRHLSHCASCLRQARLAGIEDAARRTPSKAAKIAAAAFAPIPWLRFRRGHAAERVVSGGGHAVSATRALQSVAPFVGSPGSFSGVGRAATAAAIAIAGAGGGLVAGKVVSLPAKPAGIISAHGTSAPGASGGTASGGGVSSQQSVARALGLTGVGSVTGGVASGSSGGNSTASPLQSVPRSLGGTPAAAGGAIPALGAAVAGAVGAVSGAGVAAGGPPAASGAPASGGSAGTPASSPPASGDGSAAGTAVNAAGGTGNSTAGAVNSAGGGAVNSTTGDSAGGAAGNTAGGAVTTVAGVAVNSSSAVNDVGAAVPATPPPTTTAATVPTTTSTTPTSTTPTITTPTSTTPTSTTPTSTTPTSTTTAPTTTTPGTTTAGADDTWAVPLEPTPAGKGGALAVHRSGLRTRTATTALGASADAPQPAGP